MTSLMTSQKERDSFMRARAFRTGEEVDITPLGPNGPTLPKGRSTHGARLPDEWQATEAELAFGRNLGLSDAQIREEQGQFKDFGAEFLANAAGNPIGPQPFATVCAMSSHAPN